MKIAHVVSTYPPYKGGMGRVAFEYVERLRARGEEVHAFTPRTRGVSSDDPAYVHRVLPLLHVGNAAAPPSLLWRLAAFDVVHLHYPFFGGAEPVALGKLLRPRQPLVVTYHMDAVLGGLFGAIEAAHRRTLFPWILRRADRILVSSRGYAETSYLAGVPSLLDHIEEHPFGVDLARFHPGAAPDVRARLGIPEGIPVIMFVGGLDAAHHFKGLPVLLDALAEIEMLPWHAIIVGDGALRASFEATAAARGYAERVHFVGSASDEELPAYYRAADIHVFPSTERAEAFGLVALEAAASGIPTVASALDGVRTVVQDGETGLLVPPRDASALAQALERLLKDAPLRHRLGTTARARAEREFAWDRAIDRLLSIYKNFPSLTPDP